MRLPGGRRLFRTYSWG